MTTVLSTATINEWKNKWQFKSFKTKLILGFVVLICLLFIFPFFFEYIEKRNGIVLKDPILAMMPSVNLSIIIFSIIWTMGIWVFIRCIQCPEMFIIFLWSFIFLSISRILTISMVPLNPPAGLVPLKDPVVNIFYGEKTITKDLFYSGHTATQFLIFLCLRKKTDKIFGIIATILIGVMVLIQHIHYSIDVIAAPFFSYMVYELAKIFTSNNQ